MPMTVRKSINKKLLIDYNLIYHQTAKKKSTKALRKKCCDDFRWIGARARSIENSANLSTEKKM